MGDKGNWGVEDSGEGLGVLDGWLEGGGETVGWGGDTEIWAGTAG